MTEQNSHAADPGRDTTTTAPARLDDPGAPCVSCGAPLRGLYCAACGEQRALERDLSLRSFVRDAFQSVTSLDTRGARSLRYLITRPGFLTAEYAAGRRRGYLSPLQLFLLANLLFFVAAAFLPVITFDTPLDVHLYNSPYEELARQAVRNRFADSDTVDFVTFRARFNWSATQQAKSLLIIFVPLFALVIALMRVARREPAGKHIAFGFHFMAFALLLFIAMAVAILLVRIVSGGRLLAGDSPVIPLVGLVCMVAYLEPAFRRAYGSSGTVALVQAVLLAAVFLPLIGLFRLILFFTVFYTT